MDVKIGPEEHEHVCETKVTYMYILHFVFLVVTVILYIGCKWFHVLRI